MKPYHKINSVFKRGEKGRFTEEFAQEEFHYLWTLLWQWEEKIDGTNIRVEWDGVSKRTFGGRTNNAQIPAHLITKLEERFPMDLLIENFAQPITFYGEGFGHKIQRGGLYLGEEVDFCLFDIWCGEMWLRRDAVYGIAKEFNLLHPIGGFVTLAGGIDMVRAGFDSNFGEAKAEGMILRPTIELNDRRGNRIITKLKTKDFRK